MHWPSSRDTGLISEILGWFEDIGLISRCIAMNLTKGENKPHKKKDPHPKTKNNKNKKQQQKTKTRRNSDCWRKTKQEEDPVQLCTGFTIAKLYCHRHFCKIHLCNLYLRKHVSYWPLLRERNCPFPIFKSTFTFSETLFSYEIQYHSNWMYDGAIRSSTDSQCLSDDHLVSQSHEVKMWLKNWA